MSPIYRRPPLAAFSVSGAARLTGKTRLVRRYAIELLPYEPDEGEGFTVLCPSLPGVVTQGNSIEQCHERAQEAILVYLETLRDIGRPIPESDPPGDQTIHVVLD